MPLDPDLLRKLLREHPEVKVVALVHHETGTTVLNPLRELASVVREAGRVIIVDTVASLGGVELAVDDWGIDVCVTAANKCLEALPGIGFISISPHAWELVDSLPDLGHGWYLNLKTWRWYAKEWGAWHPSPVTLPVNNISGGKDQHAKNYRARFRSPISRATSAPVRSSALGCRIPVSRCLCPMLTPRRS